MLAMQGYPAIHNVSPMQSCNACARVLRPSHSIRGLPRRSNRRQSMAQRNTVPNACSFHRQLEWGPEHLGIKRIGTSGSRTLIFRTDNIGMDIGSHNITMGYFKHIGRLK